MKVSESAICFDVEDQRLVGISHTPIDKQMAEVGVLVVVGGPQYRVGSHRQFVLLARALARAGYPTLRFDCRGMGDSEGATRDFMDFDADIAAAIDAFIDACGIQHIVIWALCDGASAAMNYASGDARVRGLVVLNPWVHTEATEAKVRLRSYYLGRLRNREFWRKVVRLDFGAYASMKSFIHYLRQITARRTDDDIADVHFIDKMRTGWEAFTGPSLLILSGDDMTAQEFKQLCRDDRSWQQLATRSLTQTVEIPNANHTFARAAWRAQVENETVRWLETAFS